MLEELRRENGSLRELLQQLADGKLVDITVNDLLFMACTGWRSDNTRQYEELLNTVRDTAQTQIPFNIGRVRIYVCYIL